MVDPMLTVGFTEVRESRAVSVEEMKLIEDMANSIGISRMVMMENAGGSIARFIFQNHGELREKSQDKVHVLLVAGTGNNGGDCFVVARHLAYWKNVFEISIVIIGKPEDIKAPEARENYEILKKNNSLTLIHVSSQETMNSFSSRLSSANIVVAGIFGTGFKGEPRTLQREVIELINENSESIKLSVDVPSGLEAQTGKSVTAVRSDYTITMHAPKVGMLNNDAAKKLCGRILIANIGIPQ